MSKYSKINFIYFLQKWMDSVPGQTFLNYAYSWGAAVVILGTLFKLTHLPGANFMLFLGMGTEVVVFFISAFDRPFDKTTIDMDLDNHMADEVIDHVAASPLGEPMVAPSAVRTVANSGVAAPAAGGVVGGNANAGRVSSGAAPVVVGGGNVGGGTTIIGGGAPVIGGGTVSGGVAGGTTIIGGGAPVSGGTVVVGGGSPAAAGTVIIGGSQQASKGEKAEEIKFTETSETSENNTQEANTAGNEQPKVATASVGTVPQVITPAPAVSQETAAEMEVVTKAYIERLAELNEMLEKVGQLTSRLSTDSEEMENLNRTLTGIARVYEMQLKSASQQITTQDSINEQTRIMAQKIQELNSIYTRMIEAMTVNMPGGMQNNA